MPLKRCPPCPCCGSQLSRVVLGKEAQGGEQVRRRHCEVCDHRWYTMQPGEQAISEFHLQWGRRGSKVKVAIPS
jgi:transcriptional regulator NrdR family protein